MISIVLCAFSIIIPFVGSIVTDEQYGRLPHVFELDNFDSCMLLGKESLYCTIEFQMKPIDPENTTETWNQIQELIDNPKNYRHDKLRHGICVALTCPNLTRSLVGDSNFRDSLASCYNKKFESRGIYGTITQMYCQNNESIPYDKYDMLFIYFLLVYFIFIIFATFYEGLARYKPKADYDKITGTTFGKFISCFSIPKNFYRLQNVATTPETETLKCIQGIRFFNMGLVILTHCVMSSIVGPISNLKMSETFTDKFPNIFLAAGEHAVQTFFLISSWMLTYHVLLAFENDKKLSMKTIFWILVNRYTRLTPTLAVAIGFNSTLLGHSPRGPFWDHIVGEDYRNCRRNGWSNLLYINNYVNPSEMCMQHTWYIASDTQLFILASFILAATKKFKHNVKWILGTCLIIGISIPGLIAFWNNYDIVMRKYPEPMYEYLLNSEEWHVLYSSGYSSIGAYVIGIIFGYLYYSYRNVNLVTAKIYTVLYFLLSYGMAFGIVAIAYPMYDLSFTFTNVESGIHWSLGKNIFTLAIAIGIFGMTQNLGWFGLWICRWHPLQVLGRLTYSAYLIHVLLLRIKMATVRQPFLITEFLVLYWTAGDIAVSYMCAFCLCLTVEMPTTALQKLVLPQKRPKIKETPQILVEFPKEKLTTSDIK